MKYICPICHKHFKAYQRRTTCSRLCLTLFQQNRVKVECDYCGVKTEKKKSEIKKHVFCTRKCSYKFQSKSKTKFPQLRDKDWCETQYATKSMAKIAREIGCSEVVINKFFHLHKIKILNHRHLAGRKKTQEHCKKISESKIQKGTAIGSKNPNWKGGITKLAKRIRSLSQYNTWRQEVLALNKKECVLCGSTHKLEVDHIKQFRFIISDNNITTIEEAKFCKEFWNPSNGRILCKNCNLQRES